MQRNIFPPLNCILYHGKWKGQFTIQQLETCDVVLNTYDTLRTEYLRFLSFQAVFVSRTSGQTHNLACDKESGLLVKIPLPSERTNLPLYLTIFHRIILDEGHKIGSLDSKISSAVHHLESRYRIVSSGTVFNNDYEDIHAVMRFLRVQPWSNIALFNHCFCRKPPGKKNQQENLLLESDRARILAISLHAISVRRLRNEIFSNKDGEHKIEGMPDLELNAIRDPLSPREQIY